MIEIRNKKLQSPVGVKLFHENNPELIDHSSEYRDSKQVLRIKMSTFSAPS